MTVSSIAERSHRLSAESQDGFRLTRTRVYSTGTSSEATLASLSLELGDYLPGVDSDYEIIASRIEFDRSTDKRLAICTGLKHVLANTNASENPVDANPVKPWCELIQTRKVATTLRTKRWTIQFVGPAAHSVNPNSPTTAWAPRPTLQQTYGQIVETNLGNSTLMEPGLITEPEIISVYEIQKATRNKSYVTVVFEGFWVSGYW